jgi:AmmeMemoRadiSam system protein B
VQNPGNARKIAVEIFAAAKITNRKVHFLASSDFSHYVKPDFGRSQDDKIISKIMDFDLEGVYQVVKKHHISACGYGPIMSLMHFAKLSGKEYQVEILGRGNSGEVSPSDEVVDYISLLFFQ